MPKKIPYAVANFEEIINENYYFVDHTRFLHLLEQYKNPVFLRPRRFGKSLWCSVLECYYDILRQNKFTHLFGNLDAGKNPTGNQNKYLVLRFNFSTVYVSDNLEQLEKNFIHNIYGSIGVFLSYYKHWFKDLIIDKNISADKILQIVLEFVQKNNLPPIYLIIDEYDNFTNQLITNYTNNIYEQVTQRNSWLQTFFKVIKAGTEDQTVGKTYITGVLPITIDDLTSGFNVAQFISLDPQMSEMLGFTDDEVTKLLQQIYLDYKFDQASFTNIKDTIKTNYNGYRFNLRQKNLVYNSTLTNYFLFNFIIRNGELPDFFIDENLRTDYKWIKKITVKIENTKKLLDDLVSTNSLEYNRLTIKDKFKVQDFFEAKNYPLAFFSLGLLTIKNEFELTFPNLTMRDIFVDYFNEVQDINVNTLYAEMMRTFLDKADLRQLFSDYWKIYVSQIEAQTFDKANENFFRTTFYALVKQFLSGYFVFAVEYQVASGRIDYIMIGRDGTKFAKKIITAEFKYWTNKDGKKEQVLKKTAPDKADVEQSAKYKKDLNNGIYSDYAVEEYVIYVVGNKGHIEWRV